MARHTTKHLPAPEEIARECEQIRRERLKSKADDSHGGSNEPFHKPQSRIHCDVRPDD